MPMPFEMLDTPEASEFERGTIIKVIGVGGCGGNAVQHMIECGVQGVEFICANTDAQALAGCGAGLTLQLGQTGLGAGSKPDAGRAAALEAEGKIREAIKGAHMLFITAGMGGGTGTGAAPVVARLAREMGVLTVGVVTKPFEFEGSKRMNNAKTGLEELEKHVDSLIVVLNDKLFDVYGEDVSLEDAMAHGNDVLKNAVGGIAEIINVKGMMNVDFEDVKTVMSEPGKALMGTGLASGPDRARLAAQQAVTCPLLEGVELSGASGVLVNITASRSSLKAAETRSAMSEIRTYAAEDAHIIFGTAFDDSLGDQLRVTVVATGLKQPNAARQANRPFTVLRTGTNDAAPAAVTPAALGGGIAAGIGGGIGALQYDELQKPTVWRNPRQGNSARVESLMQSGVEEFDIPAYLRKQND